MVATYPSSVRPFVAKTDLVDKVLADHVNALQEEVASVETIVGLNPQISTAPNPANVFTQSSTTYASLAQRLANIEVGIVADAHTQYVRSIGGSVIGAPNNTTVPLQLQGKIGTTVDLFQVWTPSRAKLALNVDSTGNVFFGGQSLPMGRLASGKVTAGGAGAGAGNEAMMTGITCTFAAVSSRRYRVTLSTTMGDIANTGSGVVLRLRDGTTTSAALIDQKSLGITLASSGFGGTAVNYVWYLDNLSTATHNLTASVQSLSGSGNLQTIASATNPGCMVVEDIGT